MTLKTLAISTVAVALAAAGAGCGDKQADAPAAVAERQPAAEGGVPAPPGKGPNGGAVFDLGGGRAEFVVDHATRDCAVYFLDGDTEDAKPRPVAATELTLTTRATTARGGVAVPPMAVKLVPKDAKGGKATKFVGSDPGLGAAAEFAGTVAGVIDGKPSSGEVEE